MPVRHELARSAARVRNAKTINDIIKARLQELEKCFTCNAAFAQCALENAPELPLEKSILIPQLLLFSERNCVIGLLAPGTSRAVHAGRIIFPLQRLGRTEKRHAVTAAYFRFWSCVSSHF